MRHDLGLWRATPLTVAMALVFAGAGLSAFPASAQTPNRPQRFELRSLLGGGSEIGVSVRDVNETEVQREKLAGPSGAYVEDVRSGSPAAEAGFRAGDVVIAFDGERVRSARQLDRLVEETPAGRQVEATVSRSGQHATLKVTPAASALPGGTGRMLAPDFDMRGFGPSDRPFPGFGANAGRLGVSVQELSDQLGDYFGTRIGVLVTSVAAGTPAATAGVKAGDVITKVNGTTINSVTDLRRSIADASDEVTLTIVRDRKELTLKATFGDARSKVRTTI